MDNEEVIGRIERLICSGDGTYEWTVEINTDDTNALKIALNNLKAISNLIFKE